MSGVGHEVDVTIADFAADHRAPTPSAAAEVVVPDASAWVRNLAGLDRRLRASARRLLHHAGERQRMLQARLERQHPERRLQQLQQRRDELELRLLRAERLRLRAGHERLDRLRARMRAASPAARVQRLHERLLRQRERLDRGMRERLRRLDARLAGDARALDAVSPLRTLNRGYALVLRQEDGRTVTDSAQVAAGDALDVRLARGRLDATVTASHEPEDD